MHSRCHNYERRSPGPQDPKTAGRGINRRGPGKRVTEDRKAAEEMISEVGNINFLVNELKELIEGFEDFEVVLLVQEQTSNMEEEGERYLAIANSERKAKGLFKWW